jgi:DNA-binding MarR family transcriptional regulator
MTPMPDHVFTVQNEYDKLMRTVKLVLGEHPITTDAGLMVAMIGCEMISADEIKAKRYYIGTNTSYTIRQLEKYGYLFREIVRNDKRKKAIRLTPKGRELADQIRIALGGSAQKRVAA